MDDALETWLVPHWPPPLLDNLGITIHFPDLPSDPLFHVVDRAMFGSNWPSWLWCVHIRPWACPGRQAEIEAAWDRVKVIRKQELLNAVLEQGKGLIDAT